ncbi:MAG: hypothetical protein IJR29_05430 [Butyrivibrio sp.]|nr:hypothetical protein [Butyrivibrio sp.]
MWINESLLIWKDHWIDVNKSLPSVYNPYKERVIRSEALPDLLKNEQGFQVLCQKGILTKENLESALSRLEQITDVPKETIISMVNGK